MQIARTIADSPLVKTAIAGADPNWGRIISAAGYAGVAFDTAQVTLLINGLLGLRAGGAGRLRRGNRVRLDSRQPRLRPSAAARRKAPPPLGSGPPT